MRFEMATVVIPTYNEIENIEFLLSALVDFLPGVAVLVVDDNSPDGTSRAVENFSKKHPQVSLIVRPQKEGLGRAYRAGFANVLESDRDLVVTMDADLSHDFHEIPKMLDLLDAYDFVVGSRYTDGGGIKNWKWYRAFLSWFANSYVRFILGAKIRDFTSGFLCFKKKILPAISFSTMEADGYAFLVEMKHRAYKQKFSIREHPIVFTERREGKSKMSWEVIGEAVLMPWRLRWK